MTRRVEVHPVIGKTVFCLIVAVFAVSVTMAMLNINKSVAVEGDPSFRSVKGYGVNYADLWGSNAKQAADMANLNDLGADWTRLPAYWYQIQEGGSTSYNWSLLDKLVSDAKANNKRILMMLLTTPTWARAAGVPSGDDGNKYPPANMADFGTFTSKLVERYAPQGVMDYEIWNEPNLSLFWKNTPASPKPNIDRYASMLQTAATAAWAKNNSVNVIAAGLSPAADAGDGATISPTTFLSGLYSRGMKQYFSAIGFHPYSYPVLPSNEKEWNAWSIMSITSFNNGSINQPSLRSIMTANGDSAKKIWLTEFGAPTSGTPDAVSEAMQSSIYVDAINLHKTYSWVGPIFFYTMNDYAAYGSSSDRENYFGLIKSNGTKKPAFAAIKAAIADNTKPVVGGYNSSLAAGTWSSVVTLKPTVSDNVAVAKVELLVDGVVKATDAVAPYEFSVDASKYAVGVHAIVIRATDTAGNVTNGSGMNFTVAAPKDGGSAGEVANGKGGNKTSTSAQAGVGTALKVDSHPTGATTSDEPAKTKADEEPTPLSAASKPVAQAISTVLGVPEEKAASAVLPLAIGAGAIGLPAVGYGVFMLVRRFRTPKAELAPFDEAKL